MNTPFKLKSGNKPEKSKFFGVKNNLKKLFEHSPTGRIYKIAKKAYKTYKSKVDLLKSMGYSDKDIKGK